MCFIAQLDISGDDAYDLKGWDKHLMEFAIYNVTCDFIKKIGNSICFSGYNGEIIAIVSSDNDEKVFTRQVLSISNGISGMVKKILECGVTIGVGRCYNNIFNISASYKEAKEAIHFSNHFGRGKIYDIRSIDISEIGPDYHALKELDAFLNIIRAGDKKNAMIKIDSIIHTILHSGKGNIYPINLKLLYMDIINSIFKSVFDLKSANFDLSEYSLRFMEQLYKLQTVNEITEWLRETVDGIIDLFITQKDNKKRKIVETALDYIHEHYNEPLSLNVVADKLFLNAAYFCKIFTEDVGESFTKYLMKYRIQKSKELMSDPAAKIYEISNLVGYDNVRYFTRVFKAFEGISPVQYRQNTK